MGHARSGRADRPRRLSGAVAFLALATLAAVVTFVATSDGVDVRPDELAWLGDEYGQATGIDPATGLPMLRLRLGGPADGMTVSQAEGFLVVRNTETGEVFVVDLSTLVAQQVRADDPESVEVLLVSGGVYIVEWAAGVIERIDPATAGPVGSAWHGHAALLGAVADRAGLVWVLAQGGQVIALSWTGDRLREMRRVAVAGVGDRAVLVPHEHGVTLLDPDEGIVVRVGTGDDSTVRRAFSAGGPLTAAEFSPVDLVAAAVPDDRTVLLVTGGGATIVGVAGHGCDPGRPVEYHGRVYVPCAGAGRVLVLSRTGAVVDVIETPPGDSPVVLRVGDQLLISVPSAGTAFVVPTSGSSGADRGSGGGSLPGPGSGAGSGGSGTGGGGSGGPGPVVPTLHVPVTGPGGSSSLPPTAPPPTAPTAPPPTAPDPRPTNVVATANPGVGTVRLTWTPGGAAVTGYQIRIDGSSTVLATPGSTADTALINMRAYAGVPVRFVVVAVTQSGSFVSTPSNVVVPMYQPPTRCGDVICLEPYSPRSG